MKDTHGGDAAGAAKRAGINPDDVVDFSASLSPLGPPKAATKAAKKAIDSAAPYPDPEAGKLREAICVRYGLDPSAILPANGSTELIYLAAQALRPRAALIVGPAFSEYAASLDAHGCRVEYFIAAEDDNFVPDIRKLADMVSSGFDVVYLANPSNPAGAVVKKDDVLKLAEKCFEGGVVLIIDEAFADFAPEYSVIDEAPHTDGLIVLRSLTKYYGLAGLRLGFMVACPGVIESFSKVKPPWSVNTPAIAAGSAALGDKEFDEATGRWLGPEKARLVEGIEAVEGLRVFPSVANYLLVKIMEGYITAGEMKEELLSRGQSGGKGLLIRDLSYMEGLGEAFFRVAVLGRDDNEMLVRELSRVMDMKRMDVEDSKKRRAT